jgi:hypothetical protein
MPAEAETCTMCGDFCAMKKGMQVFNNDIGDEKRAGKNGKSCPVHDAMQ